MPFETIFLDRDGVINRKLEGDYVKSWEEFEFLPGVRAALAELTAARCRLIVVTNQRGVALGLMTEAELRQIHARMLAELAAVDARVDAVYYCPHDRHGCDCRKPLTGMFRQARRDFPAIDFARSAMIGDSLSDLEAGRSLGCHTIFIGGRDQAAAVESAGGTDPHFLGIVPSLPAAVPLCLAR